MNLDVDTLRAVIERLEATAAHYEKRGFDGLVPGIFISLGDLDNMLREAEDEQAS